MGNFRSGPRRNKSWFFIDGASTSMTADGTFALNGLSTSTQTTVMRCLGEYIITPTSAPAAADRCEVTVAIGVVSSDAFAVGASALPDPGSEPDYPWLYWQSHALFFPTTDPESGAAAASVRHTFDVKSMRKINARESLILVAQYRDGNGLPPVTLAAGSTRVLLAT